MKAIITAIAAALCASCAPKVIPVIPITPAVVHLGGSIKATHQASKRASSVTQETVKKATVVNEFVAKSVVDADNLAKRGTATQAELDANAARWREAWQASLVALDYSRHAQVAAQDSEAQAQATATESAAVEKAAVVTDANTDTMKTKITADAGKVALVDGLAWWTKVGIAIFIVLLLLFAFVKYTAKGAAIAAKITTGI